MKWIHISEYSYLEKDKALLIKHVNGDIFLGYYNFDKRCFMSNHIYPIDIPHIDIKMLFVLPVHEDAWKEGKPPKQKKILILRNGKTYYEFFDPELSVKQKFYELPRCV